MTSRREMLDRERVAPNPRPQEEVVDCADYARRRRELFAREPLWACLACLLEFTNSADYHKHISEKHDPR